jgi:hypothetical protein
LATCRTTTTTTTTTTTPTPTPPTPPTTTTLSIITMAIRRRVINYIVFNLFISCINQFAIIIAFKCLKTTILTADYDR